MVNDHTPSFIAKTQAFKKMAYYTPEHPYLGINSPLKNYLHCRCGVKNKLKMLIYYA